jgi:hypothetical protein
MGKKAKEHRKKIAKRNEDLKKHQKKAQNIHKEMLMKMIEKEKNSGMFNSPVVPINGPLSVPVLGPNLGMGPSI